jgi:hypothetical protein
MLYIRKKSSDTWHWIRSCSNYPIGSDVVTSTSKPTSGELCNQCKAKDKN